MHNSERDQFEAKTRVPRETLDKFELYAGLLREWNERFNLVAESTLPDLWERHFWDSAQLYPLLPESPFRLADFGSGAGFPGLVLALMGAKDVHLVESTGKKADFLRAVAEKLELTGVIVHQERIEALESFKADVVTVRALKALPDLMKWTNKHLAPAGFALFMKGKKAEAELTEARKWWTFGCDKIPSQSDPSGVILKITDLKSHAPYERYPHKHNRR